MTAMVHDVQLTGYAHSVYTWAMRIALAETGVSFAYVEANPFEQAGQEVLRASTPFGRVPVLYHGAVCVYETAAILDYVDAEFGGGRMTPADPLARARMRQVISIVDAYGYWPLVRQVFSHAVYAPLSGEVCNPAEIAAGLKSARPILAALEEIAIEGLVLGGGPMTLADCHLMPMIDYFTRAAAGLELLSTAPALQKWFGRVQGRSSVQVTRPVLETLKTGGRR